MTPFRENGPPRCVDGAGEAEGKRKGKKPLSEGPSSAPGSLHEAASRVHSHQGGRRASRGRPGSTARSGIEAQACSLTGDLVLVLRAHPLSLLHVVQCGIYSSEVGEVPAGHRWADIVLIPLRAFGEKKNLR